MPTPARVIALHQPPAREKPDASWPLADYLEWWIRVGSSDRAPKTRETYGYALRHVTARLGSVPIGELSPMDFQTVVSELRASKRPESSIYLAHAAVSSALGEAVERYGILASNPARGVRVRQSDPPERTVLTLAQVARLLDYMATRPTPLPCYAVIGVMLQTGARIMEAVAPRADDLDLDGPEPVLRIQHQAARSVELGWHRARTKSRRGKRTVPFPAEAVMLVRRRIALHPRPPVGDDWAIGTTLDRPVSDTAISAALAGICRATGTPVIRPHECRTTYLTNLARAGVDLATLAKLAGDAPETIVEHYIKTDDVTARAAVARVFPSLARAGG